MTEQQLRTHLRWQGADYDEIEDAVDNWASDEYDREKDYQAEEKANADKS